MKIDLDITKDLLEELDKIVKDKTIKKSELINLFKRLDNYKIINVNLRNTTFNRVGTNLQNNTRLFFNSIDNKNLNDNSWLISKISSEHFRNSSYVDTIYPRKSYLFAIHCVKDNIIYCEKNFYYFYNLFNITSLFNSIPTLKVSNFGYTRKVVEVKNLFNKVQLYVNSKGIDYNLVEKDIFTPEDIKKAF